MKKIIFLCIAFSITFNTMAAEEIFSRTPEGEIKIRTLPAARWIMTEASGTYFDKSGDLFGRLFNFIKDNDISMTVPVEGDLSQAQMRFYLGGESGREFKDTENVRIVEVSARTVASMGGKGSYSEDNIAQVRIQLENWIETQTEWVASGSPYAVFWNGPLTLWFLKHFEVHIPVKPAQPNSS